MAVVYIPGPMRRLTEGRDRVEASGATISEVLEDLGRRHPGIRDRLFDAEGDVKRFVNVFLNGDEIRGLEGVATRVSEGDEVAIIPAMAGGEVRRLAVAGVARRGPRRAWW